MTHAGRAGNATAALALLAALLPSLACGESRPSSSGESERPAAVAAEPEWPEGTVIAIDDLPISRAEVDRIAEAIGDVFPSYALAHDRRLALTNVVIPKWAVRSRDRAARDAALAECQRASSEGDYSGALVESGTLRTLGVDLWIAARGLEPGRWTGPVELVGRWVLLRLEERTRVADVDGGELSVSVVSFPYLDLSYLSDGDLDTSVQAAIDASRLRVVDPEWRELIPESLQHRMRAP